MNRSVRVTSTAAARAPFQVGQHQVTLLVLGDILGGGESLVGAVPGLGGVPGDGVGAGQCLVGEGQVPVADAVLLAQLQDPAGVVPQRLDRQSAAACYLPDGQQPRLFPLHSGHGRALPRGRVN